MIILFKIRVLESVEVLMFMVTLMTLIVTTNICRMVAIHCNLNFRLLPQRDQAYNVPHT